MRKSVYRIKLIGGFPFRLKLEKRRFLFFWDHEMFITDTDSFDRFTANKKIVGEKPLNWYRKALQLGCEPDVLETD